MLRERADLETHPQLGASWEGFVLEQLIQTAGVREEQCSHWGKHSGAEIDFIVEARGKLFGIECKFSDAPKLTESMSIGINDLGLEKLFVIYPGNRRYPITDKIEALGLAEIPTLRTYLSTNP